MPRKNADHVDLKDACVEAAQAVIAEHGIEKLSLRDVARRLNVSHQAPYRHYASRDHLLSEVIRRSFRRFAVALDSRKRSEVPMEDMRALGHAYLNYALAHPLEYRLMFGTPWPAVEAHAELVLDSRLSFAVLRDALAPLYGGLRANRKRIESDALFVWAAMHGLATILQSQAMDHLDLQASVLKGAVEHVMGMVDVALQQSAKDATTQKE